MPPPARRFLAAPVAALLVVAAAAGLLGAARVGWVATRTGSDQTRDAQVRYLERALDGGAASRMQGLFPEGFVFTQALTGLAAARPATPGNAVALGRVSRALAALDSPAGRAPFTAVTWAAPAGTASACFRSPTPSSPGPGPSHRWTSRRRSGPP